MSHNIISLKNYDIFTENDEERYKEIYLNSDIEIYVNKENLNEISIPFHNLSNKRKDQIKKVLRIIRDTKAYSIFYYKKEKWWKYTYWIGGFLAIILSACAAIVNNFFDPCNDNKFVRNYNTILHAAIAIGLGILAFLDSSMRRRVFEEAGDKYNTLSMELYREVFFSDEEIQNLEMGHIIEKALIQLGNYGEMYNEHSEKAIEKIKEKSGLAIQFSNINNIKLI